MAARVKARQERVEGAERPEPMVGTSLKIERQLLDELRALAAADGTTVGVHFQAAVREYLARQRRRRK